MIKEIVELINALIKLLLVIIGYTAIYGGLVYILFGVLSVLGLANSLDIIRSLVCGLIILTSQTLIYIIKKGF